MPEGLVRLATVAAALSFVLVALVRKLAVRHGVLDHPTDRSSHAIATPRGGGLGLIVAVLALGGWRATRPFDWTAVTLLAGAAIVATVGWVDDRRGLTVRTRLAVHLAAGVLVGIVAATAEATLAMRILFFAWWTFWTVSSINLVNFMDGINGLVASQVAVFAMSLAISSDPPGVTPFYAIALAGACLGFLPWNFPRARIFLGDVGSGGLGFLVPVLALFALRERGIDSLRAHLPLLPLYGDAVMTIARRWRRGERLTEAHRSHLYQRLANGRLGHTRVTLIYAAVSVCGLVVAHQDGSPRAKVWVLTYVGFTVLVGLVLERFAGSGARAAS